MNRSILFVTTAWLTVGPNLFGWSQDKPPAGDEKPAANVDVAANIAQQNSVAEQYNVILRGIKGRADVAALEAEMTAAQKAVAESEAADPDLTEARGAQRAAATALRSLVEQQLAVHPEGAKALSQLKTLRDERAALLWDAALAQFRIDSPLSPISRALADDVELVELQAKVQSASPTDRPAAQAAVQARRQKKIAEREDGKSLLAEVEAARGAADKLAQTIVVVEERLAPLRKQMESAESTGLVEAQAAVNRALDREHLKQLRATHAAAIEKYNARVKALIAADPDAERLKVEYEKLGQQVRDLRKAVTKPQE